MKPRFVIPFLLYACSDVLCCQPPVPAFRTAASIPASPSYSPTGLVSGVQNHQPSQPQQSISVASSIDQELTPFQSNDVRGPHVQGITPYPGYIPPPVEYPTLIQRERQSLTRVNDNSLQQLEDELFAKGPSPPATSGCPSRMTSLSDVMNCLQLLPPTHLNENAPSCDFEQETACRFQPTSSSFQTARFPSSHHYSSFSQLSGRDPLDTPHGAFLAMIQRNPVPAEEEAVLSTPITCQTGNGNLTFSYWFTGNSYAKLQVCTQDYTVRSCTKSILYLGSSMVSVEVVHPNSTVFDVEIVVSNMIQSTVFVIDNIDYQAEMCESRSAKGAQTSQNEHQDVVESFFQDEEPSSIEVENEPELLVGIPTRPTDEPILHTFREQNTGKQGHGLIGPPGQLDTTVETATKDGPPSMTPFDVTVQPIIENIDPCKLINCSFDGTFCGYSNYKNESIRTSEWNLGSEKVGNPHTGIRREDTGDAGGFLYVGTDSSDHAVITYILESATMHLEEDVLLSVDIYRRSNDITLQVCLNTPFYCPYTVSPFEKGVFWKEGETFSIAKGTEKIFFKAIQWRKFKWLAIDNVRISGGITCS